jgi:hypothetical protein
MHAVGGTILRGKSEPAPGRDSIQTLVATKHAGEWQFAASQNTHTRLRIIGGSRRAFLARADEHGPPGQPRLVGLERDRAVGTDRALQHDPGHPGDGLQRDLAEVVALTMAVEGTVDVRPRLPTSSSLEMENSASPC